MTHCMCDGNEVVSSICDFSELTEPLELLGSKMENEGNKKSCLSRISSFPPFVFQLYYNIQCGVKISSS